MSDEIHELAEDFELLSLKSLKKDSLSSLWQKTSVLLPRNLLEAIVCEGTMNSIRRELRKKSGVLLPPEDILKGFRRLLNETSAMELADVQISLPKKHRKKRASSNSGGDGDSSDDPSTGHDDLDEGEGSENDTHDGTFA